MRDAFRKPRSRSVHSTRSAGLALALALAIPSIGVVQEAAPETDEVFQEAISVIEVEVWVRVERKGQPVRGLRQGDFEVRSGGRELPIVAYEEADFARVREDAAQHPEMTRSGAGASAPDAPARNFLVLIELGWTSNLHLQRAAEGLRELVDGGRLGPDDAIALGLWGRTAAKLVHGFTTDREVMRAGVDVLEALLDRAPARQRAALAELRRTLPGGDRVELARQIGLGGALLVAEEPDLRALFSGPAGTGFGADLFDASTLGRISAGDGDPLGLQDLAESQSVVGALAASNRALSELVLRLSGVSGPRHVLLFLQGFPGFSHMLMEFGTVYGPPPAAAELLRTYHSLTDDLIGAGWVVHAFDPTGVGGGSSGLHPGHEVTSTQSAGFVPFRRPGGLTGDGIDVLFYLAKRTGGDVYDNYNRLAPALERTLERTSSSYRIVFQVTGDFVERDLPYQVVLRGGPSGAELVSAREYRVLRESLDLRRDPRQLQRRLLGDEELEQLSARVSATALPAAAGMQRVALTIDVPLGGDGMRPKPVWIQAASLDQGTSTAAATPHDLWVQIVDLTDEPGRPSRLVALGDLVAPCEGARLRVRLTAGEGEHLETLVLPGCATASFFAFPIRSLDVGTLVTHEPGFEPADVGSSAFALGGRAFLPASEPVVVTSGGALPLLVHAERWSERSRVEALLMDDADRPVRTGPLEPAQLERIDDQARFLTSFPLDGLPAGAYRLFLRWLDGDDVVANREIAVAVP